MPRRSILKVIRVTYTPNAPWMVRVPEPLQHTEGALRKFFKKESVAKAYMQRLMKEMGDYHTQALGLTASQKIEAADCFRLLESKNVRLMDAVRHYLSHLEETTKSVKVHELFDEFLKAKRQDGISPKYETDLRSKLGRFVRVFRDELACNLTTEGIESWLRNLAVQSVSRESYRRNIGVMLEFGRRRGWLRSNPATEIKITRRIEGEVTILSTDEVSNLLKMAAPEIVPYIAICAFAGLRPSEAENINWEDIHFESFQIEVKARHSKTRRYRLVPIQPNLAAWLQRYRRASGPIGYLRTKFREAYKAAGMDKWKMDVLRHSYGTYRLPILKSAEALALEMGNSPDIIFRHYRRPMSEGKALTYFAITPESVEKHGESTPPSDASADKVAHASSLRIPP